MNIISYLKKILFRDYSFIILYILFVLFFSVFYLVFEWRQGINKIDRYLEAAAKTVPLLLADDFHDRALTPESISFEEEIKNRIKINSFVKLTELEWIYTLVKYKNSFYFSAPTVTDEEAAERVKWYFYPYDDIPVSFTEAYEEEKTVYKTYEDQWGSYRSIAKAEKSPGGIVYLVCADMNIKRVREIITDQYLKSFLFFVLFIMLSTVIIIRLIMDRRKIVIMNNELVIHKNNLTALVEKKTSDIFKINEQLIHAEQQLKMTIAEGGMGIVELDSDNDVLYPGDSGEILKKSGIIYNFPASLSDLYRQYIHKNDREIFKRFLNDLLNGKLERSYAEFRYKKDEEGWIWLSFLGKRVDSGLPEPSETVFILFEIIDDRKKREIFLEKRAAHDSLTGIYNREYYIEFIESINLNKRLNDFPLTVCYIDINGLKEVNDRFGHSEGDDLLTVFCGFVIENLRKTDIFCRIGGDEFLILCPGISNNDFSIIWNRIINSVEQFNEMGEKPYLISFSHGVIELNHEDLIMTAEKIIALADEMMYLEKKRIKKESLSVIRNCNG